MHPRSHPKSECVTLSAQDREDFTRLRGDIDRALSSFASVPRERWLREVALCLLTPQSSPVRAEAAMVILEKEGLFEGRLDASFIATVLRNPTSYVRFHHTRSKRLVAFTLQSSSIFEALTQGRSAMEEREFLVKTVNGFGYKEASHALRNIGRRNLAILDRHILARLCELKIIDSIPKTITPKRYLEIERAFVLFAQSVDIALDELDLLFWGQKTGFIFK